MAHAKYLSEVLDVSQITKSSKRKFCIISGVGSGKNYFVENILRGFGNILYISSRRAKVDEILANQDFDERIDWRKEVEMLLPLLTMESKECLRMKSFQLQDSEMLLNILLILL